MRILLFILTGALCQGTFAQNLLQADLNEQVLGIFLYGNNTYLVTEKGFVSVPAEDINKQYENYYREVYGDSTIVSPNLVVGGVNDSEVLQYIVPFINLGAESNNYRKFDDSIQLHDFLIIDSTGQLIFRRGISGIVEEYLNE